ncbi:MAG: hypothetical protein ACLSVD_00885 [Eggerthellaceae bacterium]
MSIARRRRSRSPSARNAASRRPAWARWRPPRRPSTTASSTTTKPWRRSGSTEARAELDPLADEVKRRAGGLFDEVKDARSPRWRASALGAAAGTLRRGRAGR